WNTTGAAAIAPSSRVTLKTNSALALRTSAPHRLNEREHEERDPVEREGDTEETRRAEVGPGEQHERQGQQRHHPDDPTLAYRQQAQRRDGEPVKRQRRIFEPMPRRDRQVLLCVCDV